MKHCHVFAQLARLELDVAFQKQLLLQRQAALRATTPNQAVLPFPPPLPPQPLPPPPPPLQPLPSLPQPLPVHREPSTLAAPLQTQYLPPKDLNNGQITNDGLALRQQDASSATIAAARGSSSSSSSSSSGGSSSGSSSLTLTEEPHFAWRPAVRYFDYL